MSVCAFHVILWLMDVVMLYHVMFASVGSIVCVVQNEQYFFSPMVELFQAIHTVSSEHLLLSDIEYGTMDLCF